jgi:hypothetical protein
VHAQGKVLFVLYNTRVDVYSMAKGKLEWDLQCTIDTSSLPVGSKKFMSVRQDTGDLLVGSCEGKLLVFSREEGTSRPCFSDVRMTSSPLFVVWNLEHSRRKAQCVVKAALHDPKDRDLELRGQRAESRITHLLADLHCMMALGCRYMSRGMMLKILLVLWECKTAASNAADRLLHLICEKIWMMCAPPQQEN